ncbi:MAG: site-specific DNA-methyltransferase [Nitrosopumilus sp. H13]|nr:MAG: site-specific DNA-methyltransferase [Nitrosopumilus sp. H13]
MKSKAKKSKKVDRYTHEDSKRPNNPPVGLVTPRTDPDLPNKKYRYDPRLDPQLEWSGKQENFEFEVDTVSLHVHERVDPHTILEKVMKPKQSAQETMFNYFEMPENNPPLRDAIEFYKHDQNWSNRLIAGDSLLVMNSLLEKEGMEGKIQMIYIDPPYGIKYKSNFQPFINKQNVKDGKDEDLTQEPEMIKAFKDTWELKIHSYLTYLRSRLFLSKKLLTKSGSIFVQISDENLHHVREIMDEIFGSKNYVRIIQFRKKTMPLGGKILEEMYDYLVWYANDISHIKYNQLYVPQKISENSYWNVVKLPDGSIRSLTNEEKKDISNIPKNAKLATTVGLKPPTPQEIDNYDFELDGKIYKPSGSWMTNKEGMKKIAKAGRLVPSGSTLRYLLLFDDFPYSKLTNNWSDTSGVQKKKYVVQTSDEILQRCILMTTNPSDIILDPTCGSGTSAYVAEKYGRRWITIDTSRIAIFIAHTRLMTSYFDYYVLNNPKEGVTSGFKLKNTTKISSRTIINNEEAKTIVLYDKPIKNKSTVRISGPFTVEAVPAPTVKSLDVLSQKEPNFDHTIMRNLKNSHQQEWRDELLKTGIRGKKGQKIEFSKVDIHSATRWLHADAETKENSKRVMISFGPEYLPLEQRQIELAIEEARTLVPKPLIIIFAAMQFDPEAAKDIDELKWPGVTILKVEMNKDLLTKDLKKKRSSNESFWLMGQPDIELQKNKEKKYTIKVNGFDYYNTKTGEIESGGSSKIAMWSLDTDYDGRSVYPQQIFFPMEGSSGGWSKLAKTLQSQIDEELIVKYQGIESIPFEAGSNKRAAVKIVDDRGIESLKIVKLE